MKSGATRVRASRLLLIVGLAAHWSRHDAFVGHSPAAVPRRCSAGQFRALPGSRTLRHELGDIVEVRCEDDGLWYQAIVEHENSDGTFTVRFDKDGYEYHYPLVAWRVPKTRHFIEELEEGEVLNGRVTDISSSGFYVDVGAEDEGFVHISEIKEGRVVRIEDEVRIGQDVSLRVLSTRGALTLSMKPPATGSSDSMGLAAFRDLPPDALLRATITDTPTFGAFAMVQPPAGGEPCRGLIHISEMGGGGFVHSVEEQVSVGEEVLVSVLSTEGGRLSLRLQSEESGLEIEKGIWLTGSVVKTMSYGAFVKVHCQGEERVGLLHVSEMADDFIVDCTKAVSVGDNVTVQLLQSNKGRISWTARTDRVSAEELDPFVGLHRKKDVLTGLVQETCEGGAYVLLQPPDGGISVQGVLRRQEMNLNDGETVEDVLKVGEEVEVLVKFADNGRLLLSMPPLVPSAFREMPEDLWLKGVVKDLLEFGIFVTVQAPTGEEYTGLVHISQYKEGFVAPALLAKELKVGQEVSVRVIEVDGNRLSLSMKPPSSAKDGKERSPSGVVAPLQGVDAEQWLDARIQETLPFGALLSVTDPGSNETLLGKIHIFEMSDRYLELVHDAVAVNDSVKVRLLDRDELSFSMRKAPKPLTEVAEGTEVEGQVINASNSGALVKLNQPSNASDASELWGYLPWSEVEKRLGRGAEVRCRILSLQGEKLALTMRTSDCSLKDFACKDVLNAVVQEVTALGIFVRLQPLCGGRACRGLVHVSFLKASDDFAEGDFVKVQVQNATTSLQLSLAE